MKETVGVDLLNAGITGIDISIFADPTSRVRRKPFPGDPCIGRTTQGGLSGQANAAASQSGTGMTVTAASVAGRPITFAQNGDVVRVHLPLAFPGRTARDVHSRVPRRAGDGSFHRRQQVPGPQFCQQRLAEPCAQLAGDHRPYFHEGLDHHDRHSAGTISGDLERSPEASRRICRTACAAQSGTEGPDPNVAICAGRRALCGRSFWRISWIALSSWVFPQERDNGYKGFSEPTQSILEFFIDRVGPYSYEKLAHVQANFVSGGMELASSIFYGYNGVPRRQLVAHEMAHQWFGKSASESDWDHVWLSEGFAMYFALLYQEYKDGRDPFINGVRNSAQNAMRYALANPESTIVHKNLSNISQVIANDAQVYQGGAQVLHMLRGVLGTETFWKASGSITAVSSKETLPATTFAGQCRTRALPARTAQTKAKRCGGSSTSGCTAEAFCRSPVRGHTTLLRSNFVSASLRLKSRVCFVCPSRLASRCLLLPRLRQAASKPRRRGSWSTKSTTRSSFRWSPRPWT